MKNRKLFILLFIIIIIINILIFILLLNKNDHPVDEKQIVSPTSSEYIQVRSLNVINSAGMSDMDLGDVLETDVLSYAKNYVTKFLPDMYTQINDNVDFSKEYFNRKKSAIYRYSHVYKYESFIELIETMKESNINFDEYKTIEFISSINNDESVIVNCELTYDGDKKINLQITFVNNEVKETKLKR